MHEKHQIFPSNFTFLTSVQTRSIQLPEFITNLVNHTKKAVTRDITYVNALVHTDFDS